MNHLLLRISLLVLSIIFAFPVLGQNLYVGNGSSNQTNNFTSGSNSYADSYIGYNPRDSNNTLNVLGSNTVLEAGVNIYIGYQGSGNRLIISNGGSVDSFYGIIGEGISNSALVTGIGSLWTNSDLEVGSGGLGWSSLVVSNGGMVQAGVMGIGLNSSNNSVLVTGTGSVLNSSGINLGNGSSNSLIISNGAVLMSQTVNIGLIATNFYLDNYSSNNLVLVTGKGSLWTNSGTLTVGDGGSGTLTIGTGATVAASNIVIAYQSNSEGTLNFGTPGGKDTNVSLITQSISFGGGVGTINFNQSSSLTFTSSITGASSINQLGNGATTLAGVVNGGFVIPRIIYVGNGTGDSGNLVIQGGTFNNNYAVIGNNSNSVGSAMVSGGTWNNLYNANGSITVGNSGSGTLTIGTHGIVKAIGVTIANQPGSSGTLNFGTPGLNDTNISLTAASISFGSGSGTLTFSQADTSDIACTISGYGTINQQGSGTTILTASNSFSGEVTVTSGKLQIASSGTLSGSGSTIVSLGGTLENEGALSGTTSIGGTLAGNGGSFTNLQFTGDSSLIWNINSFAGIAGTNWDELNASSLDLSALSATNPVTIHVQGISGSGSTIAPAYYTFNFLNVSNSVTGFDPSDFIIDSSLFTNALGISGGSWGVATNATNGGEQVSLIYTVPEPSSIFLLGMGLGVVVLAFEMKRKIKRRDGISNAMNFSDGGGPL